MQISAVADGMFTCKYFLPHYACICSLSFSVAFNERKLNAQVSMGGKMKGQTFEPIPEKINTISKIYKTKNKLTKDGT